MTILKLNESAAWAQVRRWLQIWRDEMDGGSRVAEVLRANGVEFLFTLCGGHISPILVEAKRRGIRVVDVRHEVNAVFAADAVARLRF